MKDEKTETIIYHHPDGQIDTLEMNGKIEEVKGYLNHELVFVMVNGELVFGSIQDVDMVLAKTLMTRVEFNRRFLFDKNI